MISFVLVSVTFRCKPRFRGKMLRGVLQETVISRIENSTDQFVLMDNVTYKNVSVTAVTTKIDQIYIFAMSDSVNIPITCKIDPKKKGIVKIKICVDISVIAVFFKDKSFDIYPIGQIVNQSRPSISPQKSDSVRFSYIFFGKTITSLSNHK